MQVPLDLFEKQQATTVERARASTLDLPSSGGHRLKQAASVPSPKQGTDQTLLITKKLTNQRETSVCIQSTTQSIQRGQAKWLPVHTLCRAACCTRQLWATENRLYATMCSLVGPLVPDHGKGRGEQQHQPQCH
eukprot:1317199-Amphidinium_carterae.3